MCVIFLGNNADFKETDFSFLCKTIVFLRSFLKIFHLQPLIMVHFKIHVQKVMYIYHRNIKKIVIFHTSMQIMKIVQ